MSSLTSNRFYNWSCATNKCKTCSDSKIHKFIFEQFNIQIKYSWFELTKTPHTKIRTTTGKIAERKKQPKLVLQNMCFV